MAKRTATGKDEPGPARAKGDRPAKPQGRPGKPETRPAGPETAAVRAETGAARAENAAARPAPGRAARPLPVRLDPEPDQDLLHEAAETFGLLSSPTRLHLLWLLARGEQDVGTLADAVHGSDAMVSQHLAKLRLADLVSARRDGKRQVYVVDDPHIVSVIHQVLDHHSQRRR